MYLSSNDKQKSKFHPTELYCTHSRAYFCLLSGMKNTDCRVQDGVKSTDLWMDETPVWIFQGL